MLSVVVPTMWKFKPFLDFVAEMVKVPEIGEIIIINNDVTNTPYHKVFNNPKVHLLNQLSNIYVNPAWNLGVEVSQYDKICIANDDVIVDLKLFSLIEKDLTEEIGLAGISPGRPEFDQAPITDGVINFTHWTGQNTFGFGSLFFIHKKNWIRIPDELVVFYGDNWIFDTQIHIKQKPIFLIENCFFHSPWAQTTGSVVNEWLGNEGSVYPQLLRDAIQQRQ